MTPDEAQAALKDVGAAMHDQFPGNPARLEQLASALTTAGMAIEHLHDEEERHQELLERVIKTPRGLSEGHPDNHAARHAHQLRPGALEEA